MRSYAALLLLCLLLPEPALSATLHGRVKDRQCSVLSRATVHIRSLSLDRTLTTDDAGDYTADLPAGEYQICIQRAAHAPATCNPLVVQQGGDKFVTTQLLDAAPDLSNISNTPH